MTTLYTGWSDRLVGLLDWRLTGSKCTGCHEKKLTKEIPKMCQNIASIDFWSCLLSISCFGLIHFGDVKIARVQLMKGLQTTSAVQSLSLVV